MDVKSALHIFSWKGKPESVTISLIIAGEQPGDGLYQLG